MSLAELYSALADPTRLRVLELLHEKPRPVHDLAAAFAISRPAISRHLRVLKEAGLVREIKQGRENVYSFQREPLKAGAGWIEKHGTAAKTRPAKVAREPAVVPSAQSPTAKVEVGAASERPAPRRAVKPAVPAAIAAASPAPQLSLFDI